MMVTGKKMFSARLPEDLIGRIRLESVTRGRRIGEIVAEALDPVIPHNRITAVVPPRRSAKDGSLKS